MTSHSLFQLFLSCLCTLDELTTNDRKTQLIHLSTYLNNKTNTCEKLNSVVFSSTLLLSLTWLFVWPVVTQCLCPSVHQATALTATPWPTATWSAWTRAASPPWSSTTAGSQSKTPSAGKTEFTPGQLMTHPFEAPEWRAAVKTICSCEIAFA